MPKIKTNKSLSKRIKITKKAKLKIRSRNQAHSRSVKSGKKRRATKTVKTMPKILRSKVKRMVKKTKK